MMKKFLQTLSFWVEKLSSRPKIGGLQISDSALQFVLAEGERPLTAAFRLPPGVIKNGVIQNKQSFLELLRHLHKMIRPDGESERVRVIVSLPAELVYTQSFNVPNIDPGLIEESARLNLQMISPLPPERVYLSWQLLSETPDQYEFLGAVAERTVIDDFARLLREANFLPTAFELPSLSLSRLINRTMTPSQRAVLTINISSDGLDLFVLRNGRLYFDHFRSWLSIQGENRQISRQAFEAAVLEETQRVINFTLSRFKEQLSQTILIAPGFEKEIKDLLESRFGLTVSSLELRNFSSLGPSWFVALGAALRGLIERSRDQEISLSSLTSLEEFYQEQVIRFVVLWRNIILGTAFIFLVIFIGINIFLVNLEQRIEQQLAGFRTQPVIQELEQLQAEVSEFNRLVGLVETVKGSEFRWGPFLAQLQNIAGRSRVSFDQIFINSPDRPISIAARAPSSVLAIEFKNNLAKESNFANVDLPLTSVVTLEDNSISFSVSFSLVR